MCLPPFDPFSEAFGADRYAVYRQYRDAGPVHPGMPGQPGRPETWYVFGYEAVVQSLKEPRLGRKGLYSHQPSPEPGVLQSMLFLDPPDHTRLRRLVSLAFTPRAIERALPMVDQLATEVLDELANASQFDVIRDFAFPFPVTVISALLGVPIAERGQIRQWSRAVTAGIDTTTDPKTFVQAQDANRPMRAYLRDVISERRHRPGDDLLTSLLTAQDASDRLSDDELVTMVTLLVIAGHETTVNLIGNGMWTLFKHPAAFAEVQQGGLSNTGVDELLRYDSSVQATSRFCDASVTIGGTRIPEGAVVVALLGAANRDPAVFADPDRIDLNRHPNRHLAFGGGIHTCLGAALARAEGRTAISALVKRYPELRPVESHPAWRPGLVFHGLESLIVQR